MSLVYSTETGRLCPECRQPLVDAPCNTAPNPTPPAAANVKVSRESKGRGGKTVTLVRGLPLDAMALALLGKQLRSAVGSGGTVKDGLIEIQGDHCDRVMEELKKQGHNPKRTGG
jgi:translation initiation factor 1